jgi:hypothetical protein
MKMSDWQPRLRRAILRLTGIITVAAVAATGAVQGAGFSGCGNGSTGVDQGDDLPASANSVPAGAINVMNYGAKANGVASDRQAVQAALDAAQPGDTVYFPAGTYNIEEPVFVRKNNLTLVGEGRGSVLKSTNGRVSVRLGPNGELLTGLVVKRLTFLGIPGKYKKDGVGGAGIEVFGPKGTLIQDCDFLSCASPVYNDGPVGSSYGTRIENCRFTGWAAVAIFCNGGEQILNCSLIQDDPDLKGERSSHGIYIHSGCTDVLVQDTLIQNARKYAAQIYGQDLNTTTARITFRNVTVKDCANGITIQQNQPEAARAKDVLIEKCSITGTYNGPALSVKQGDGVKIVNNVLDGGLVGLQLGVWAPYEPGFTLSNLEAAGNVIRHFDVGILAMATNGGRFENVKLSGNTITDCQTPVDLHQSPGISFGP